MTSSTPNWWPGTSAVVHTVITSSAGQRCFSSYSSADACGELHRRDDAVLVDM